MAKELITGGGYSKVICKRYFHNGNVYLIDKKCYYSHYVEHLVEKGYPVIDLTKSGLPTENMNLPDSKVILGHIGYEAIT